MSILEEFIAGLHLSSTILGYGKATVMGNEVEAVIVRNLYGQNIVWGPFSIERGKFKGKIANNANTEGVSYIIDRLVIPALPENDTTFLRMWRDSLTHPGMSTKIH